MFSLLPPFPSSLPSSAERRGTRLTPTSPRTPRAPLSSESLVEEGGRGEGVGRSLRSWSTTLGSHGRTTRAEGHSFERWRPESRTVSPGVGRSLWTHGVSESVGVRFRVLKVLGQDEDYYSRLSTPGSQGPWTPDWTEPLAHPGEERKSKTTGPGGEWSEEGQRGR